jgi:hypothetical protein
MLPMTTNRSNHTLLRRCKELSLQLLNSCSALSYFLFFFVSFYFSTQIHRSGESTSKRRSLPSSVVYSLFNFFPLFKD